MANVVLMPQVGITVESCIIGSWKKSIGDTVAVGDILFDYETDKAVMECESTAAGTLLELFFEDGDEVPVLTPVCAIGEAGEDVSALRPGGAAGPAGSSQTQVEPASPDGAGALGDSASPDGAGALGDSASPERGGVGAADGGVLPAATASAENASPGGAGASGEPASPAGEGVNEVFASPERGGVGAADGGVFISPRAKKLASDQHVDLNRTAATGPYGRIIERDVRAAIDKGFIATGAAAAEAAGISLAGTGIGGRVSVADLGAAAGVGAVGGSAAAGAGAAGGAGAAIGAGVVAGGDTSGGAAFFGPEYVDEEFTKIRKVIAKNMAESLYTIPQLTHNFSFDATDIIGYRAKLKSSGESLGANKISLGDMVMFAISRLLLKYPNLNAHMLDDTHVRRFNTVNLGFACDTDRGLMVPVIKNAERKSLLEISNEVKELAAAARKGNLLPDKMSGGTFTVSNLGSFGVESFTPIINIPQTGILGVDKIIERPKMKDGVISLYPAMGLSLTYDHRAIDGAPASRFVQELCSLLENFSVLLAV